MDKPEKKSPDKRTYPAIYEKTIPVLLVVVGIAIVILLVVAFAVLVGVIPGS